MHPFSPSARRFASFVICLFTLHLFATNAGASSGFATLADFPVPRGHFFTQASGQGDSAGFGLVDDDAARLFSEFQRLGGVDRLGYPSSQRFSFGGFTTQATQKELLQWRPDVGRVAFVNIFDVLADRGFDRELARTRQIPVTGDNSSDAQMPWPQVVARHLALLNQVPAIRARYFMERDPIDTFGLPQAVTEYGSVEVIRCERAAFQMWRIATPFAKSGDVTQVNAGDLAKELGIIPSPATVPAKTTGQIVAPPGTLISPDVGTQNSAHAIALAVLPSLVRIDVTLDDGLGIASGIVIDRNGDILTNEHVVYSAHSVKVTFVNGVSLPAQIIATDATKDLAVIQVPAGSIGSGVTPADFASGGQLTVGQYLVAIGFSPYFPSPPAIRLGVFQGTIEGDIRILKSDVFILPGDSGGMLVDLSGRVVGVNDEIRISREVAQPLTGYSIDAGQAFHVGQLLLQGTPAS